MVAYNKSHRTRGFMRGAVLPLLLLTGCATATPNTPEFNEEAEAAAIDAVRDRFMQAMANADFAALAQIASEDTIMIPPGSEQHLEMLAAAGEGLAPGFRIDITPIETVFISDEWAYERGTSVQSWQPEGASNRIELPNSYLILLRKIDGEWKPYREVASALPPPEGWPD